MSEQAPHPQTTPSGALHPRPQLTRAHWTSLDGEWAFAFDDRDAGLSGRWFEPGRGDAFDRTVRVPFPPESAASGLRETGYHRVVWYRRTFTVTQEDRAGRLWLHFGAVDYRAQVWVNGRLVATHEGGHTPFTADLTDVLTAGAEQVVVVRAEDDPQDLAQPRGKQDWQPEPHAIWYHRTTGIWQPVWLERVPLVHVAQVRWTPDLDRMELRLQVRVAGPVRPGLRLRVQLSIRGEPLAEQAVAVQGEEVRLTLALHHTPSSPERWDLLWSPAHPNLIGAELTLQEGDTVQDQVGSYAGMRSAAVRGGQFLLNGQPYFLRLVLAQNYWPESHLAPPLEDALRREAELVRELGFNGVRIHQKVEDPRFLYWCDVLGLLVWGEMANAYAYTEAGCERLTREWLEVLRRDYSHPCIVTWVPLNESWGVPNLERDPAQRDFVRALYHLTRALDPTRPVVGNDGWQFVTGDILGVHDYSPSGDVLRERYGTAEALERSFRSVQPYHRRLLLDGHTRGGEAVVLTEFGGLSFAPQGGERWWGYGTVGTAEAFLARYDELLRAVTDSDVLMGFCYTQLTDTEQESNGLLTAERVPKLDPAAIRASTTRHTRAVPGDQLSAVHLAAHRGRLEDVLETT